MRVRNWIIMAALGVVAAGCSPKDLGSTSTDADATNSQDNEQQFTDMLLGKAKEIAERDLARMMATELLYRNVPEFFTPIHPGRQVPVPLWLKQYRHFKSYEIKNINRTDSYIHPIEYEIHYKYNYMITPIREVGEIPNPREKSMDDTNFFLSNSGDLVLKYLCDRDGNYIGDISELPPRSVFDFSTSE